MLSSSLCEPSYYPFCTVSNLDQNNRLEKVKNKLNKEIQNRSIICLQVASYSQISCFFAHNLFIYTNRKYHKNGLVNFIHSLLHKVITLLQHFMATDSTVIWVLQLLSHSVSIILSRYSLTHSHTHTLTYSFTYSLLPG